MGAGRLVGVGKEESSQLKHNYGKQRLIDLITVSNAEDCKPYRVDATASWRAYTARKYDVYIVREKVVICFTIFITYFAVLLFHLFVLFFASLDAHGLGAQLGALSRLGSVGKLQHNHSKNTLSFPVPCSFYIYICFRQRSFSRIEEQVVGA